MLETLHSLFFKGLSKVVVKILTILKGGLLIVKIIIIIKLQDRHVLAGTKIFDIC